MKLEKLIAVFDEDFIRLRYDLELTVNIRYWKFVFRTAYYCRSLISFPIACLRQSFA